MQADFDRSLKSILREEGGRDDDPQDHGGRTAFGITQKEYTAWRQNHPGLPEDVWQIPPDTRRDIYHDQYWEPYCDDFPAGVDLEFFDFAVNAGRQQAVKTLQRTLGVPADGMMGIITKNALASADPQELIKDYSNRRRSFYRSLAQFSRYGKGWLGRVDRIEKDALAIATNAPVVIHETVPTESPKANPEDTKKPPVSTGTATTGTALGGIITEVINQLHTISDALNPFQDSINAAKYVVIGITVICAGLAIYSLIHKNKIQAAV